MTPERERELIALALPDNPAAQALYRNLAWASQVLDDVVDGDKPVTPADIVAMFTACTVDVLRNPFAQQFPDQVAEILECALMEWQQANAIEANAKALAVSNRSRAMRLLEVSYIQRSSMTQALLRMSSLACGRAHALACSPEIQAAIYLDNEPFEQYVSEQLGNSAGGV